MINRDKILRDKTQIETVLIELRLAERDGTLQTVDTVDLAKKFTALTEAVWDIQEYIMRKEDRGRQK